MKSIFIVVVFILFLGSAQGCVTQEILTNVNGKVGELVGELISNGLITVDLTTGTVSLSGTVEDLLNGLCTTESIKARLEEIQSQVKQCPQLIQESSNLQQMQIEDVDIATLFIDFDDIDHFCDCRADVPAAWVVKAMNLIYEDSASIYHTSANVPVICSTAVNRELILTVTNSNESCSLPVQKQAGFSLNETDKVQRLGKLIAADLCTSYDEAAWTCIADYAKQNDIHHCISWAADLDQNMVPCGKRACVGLLDGHCGVGSTDLYVKAVNVENPGALLQTGDTCTSYADLQCITYAKLAKVTSETDTILGGITDYTDMSTGSPVIQESDLPTVLTELCSNDTLKAAMVEIRTEISACGNLAALSTKLNGFKMGVVGFADILITFPTIDTFCSCNSDLPESLQLRENAAYLVETEPTAAFQKIAHVRYICGDTTKALVTTVEGAAADCKTSLKSLAGFSDSDVKRFDGIYEIVQRCENSTDMATDWDCMTTVAKTSTFKTCIADQNNKVDDYALCGKWNCVSEKMKHCTDTARMLYIKAVNTENSDAIRETDEGCAGARGLSFSFLALVACFVILRL